MQLARCEHRLFANCLPPDKHRRQCAEPAKGLSRFRKASDTSHWPPCSVYANSGFFRASLRPDDRAPTCPVEIIASTFRLSACLTNPLSPFPPTTGSGVFFKCPRSCPKASTQSIFRKSFPICKPTSRAYASRAHQRTDICFPG